MTEIANKLSSLASIYSRKGNYESPLYKMAQKDKLMYPKEGFLDDVSVVIARIKKDIYINWCWYIVKKYRSRVGLNHRPFG